MSSLIPFKLIGSVPMEFDVEVDNTSFKGTLVHKKGKIVLLNGTISGSISIPCDMCAEMIEKNLDEEVAFYLSEGIVNGSEEDLDIVEIMGSMIDAQELLRSELELIRSDYFCCSVCEGKSLNQEF